MKLFFFALALAVGTTAASTQELDFVQRYKPGHRYVQAVTIHEESEIDTGVTKSRKSRQVKMELESIAALAAQPGGLPVRMRWRRIQMTMDADGHRFSFDSNEPDSGGPFAGLAVATAREFLVNFSDRGEVMAVQNGEKAIAGLAGPQPLVASDFVKFFSGEHLRRAFIAPALQPPVGARLAAGASWPLKAEIDLAAAGIFALKGTCVFKQMAEFEGHQCAEVAVEGKHEFDASIKAVVMDLTDNDNLQSLVRQMKFGVESSDVKGTVLFDPAVNFTRKAAFTQSVVLTAKIPDGSGVVIKMPQKQTIEIRLIEHGPAK